MNTIVRGIAVTAPVPTSLDSSVLDHAKVRDVSGDFGLSNDAGLWPSYNVATHVTMLDFCEPDDKQFETAPWVPAFPFALQQGFRCKAVGLDTNHMRSEASRVFDATEGRGVEKLLSTILPTGGVGGAVHNLTGATARDANIALALIEGSAAATYAGVPTIHMPRYIASLLGQKIVWKGNKAYTILGSKVAIGGGYDIENPGGSAMLFATGEVYVERSTKIDLSTNVIPGDGSDDVAGMDLNDNTVLTLAERLYRVAYEPISADFAVLSAQATVWGF